MSSILTNNGAMVALQTLKSINNDLGATQSQISTGKKVASAQDNASIWAISKVMEADISGFEQISDSLTLGKSTLAVASNAAETITDLLTQIQDKVVSAQGENVDKSKIQTDIDALKSQIDSVVSAAQFNGRNLVDGSGDMSVLASLNRDSTGDVTAKSITVTDANLSTGGYTGKDVFAGSTGASATAGEMDIAATTLASGDTTGINIVLDDTVALAEGDSISVTLGEETVSYTLTAEDAAQTGTAKTDIVLSGLKSKIDALGITDLRVDFSAGTTTPSDSTLTLKVADTDGDGTTAMSENLTVVSQFKNAGSGDLSALASLDVTTTAGAVAALGKMDGLIDTAVAAAASFGSDASRLESQADFVTNLTQSLKSGVGAMVDADMEETSARLQALQVQQQLAVQSLSIANQAPQTVLSLFR